MGIDIGVVLAVAFIGLSAYLGYQKYKEHKASKSVGVRPPVILPPVKEKAVATKKAAPVAKYSKKAVKKPAAKPASNNVASKRK